MVVEITAKDNFSGALKGIKGGIGNLVTGLGLGVGSKVAEGVMNGVGNAIGQVQNQFSKALDLETMQLDLGNALESMGVTDTLQEGVDLGMVQIEKLSKHAARLPGSTQDYVQIMSASADNIVGAYQEMGKSTDEALSDLTNIISPRLGAIVAQTELTNKDVERFMSGLEMKSLAQLETEEFLMKIPKSARNKFSEAVNEFGDTATGRAKAFKVAMEEGITDEYLDELANTMTGSLGAFQDLLFGMNGIFSFSKDLNSELEGTQSVFLAVKDLFDTLVGSDGLFRTISETFGIDFEPLMGVFNLLENVTNAARGLTNSVAASGGDLSRLLGGFWERIQYAVKVWISKAFIYLNNVDVLGILSSIQAEALGFRSAFMRLLNKATQALFDWFNGIDFTTFADNIDYASVGSMLANSITTGLRIMLIEPVQWLWKNKSNIAQVFQQIRRFNNELSKALWKVFKAVASELASRGLALVGKWVQRILSVFSDWFRQVQTTITQTAAEYVGRIRTAIQNAFGAIQRQIDRIAGWVNNIRLPNFLGGGGREASNSADGNLVGPVGRELKQNPSNSADGNLVGAIGRELKQKPSNSGLTVANTSELILNRKQQAELAKRMATGNSFGSSSRSPRGGSESRARAYGTPRGEYSEPSSFNPNITVKASQTTLDSPGGIMTVIKESSGRVLRNDFGTVQRQISRIVGLMNNISLPSLVGAIGGTSSQAEASQRVLGASAQPSPALTDLILNKKQQAESTREAPSRTSTVNSFSPNITVNVSQTNASPQDIANAIDGMLNEYRMRQSYV
jgi:hypothetical protein